MTENFNILVNKLKLFKVKYYSYRLIKGIIIVLFLLIVFFSLFSILEYFEYLSPNIRKLIFFGYLLFGFLLFLQFVGKPLLKLLHIIKPIDLKSSSELIQKYFTDIQDKLLNIIELSTLNDEQYSNDIVLASIDQKIDEIKVFDFNEAIQFKNLLNILTYFIISVLAVLVVFFVDRNVFTESSHRLVHYNEVFVKPAPFTFILDNTDLKAKKSDSYTLNMHTEGEEIPQIVYINIEGNNYLMKSSGPGTFQFEIASVINPVQFYFTDQKYNSDTYQLQLLPKPGITSFTTEIIPPSYTGLTDQVFENIGDLQIPHGTKVKWKFQGIDMDSLHIDIQDSIRLNSEYESPIFHVEHSFFEGTEYSVIIRNKITEPELALSYSIDVIPDLFPEIEVVQVADSSELTRFFFRGIIGDDYGFTQLKFHYNIDSQDSTISIPFVNNLNDQEFYFSFDFAGIPEAEGVISYYFSVTDNDVINHYKTTTSNSFTFQFPNREEILASENEQYKNLEKKVLESQRLAKEIDKDLKNLQYKNMDTSISDWEKSQMVNDIVQKQNKLEQLYDQIKKDNENLNKYMNSFNKQNDDIVEKQKQIEKLLEDVFTDELKELMEEFNKLAENFDSKKLNQLTQNMKVTMEDLQEQLDRNLEMLKKYKIEQKVQEVIDEVNRMAQEEENFANQINEDKNYEEINKEVEKHQNELKDLQKQLKEAVDINKQLEKPLSMDDFEEEFNEIDKSIEENKQNLSEKKKKKSSSDLKNASDQMKNLAFGMQQMMDLNFQQQNMENIENLKQILSNLILLSFEQEDVLIGLNDISTKDPQLIELNQKQKRIADQSVIIRDSLYALAKRTPQISSTINNELVSLELNLTKAKEQMEEGIFPSARSSQQFVITSVNNLALLLNESLENLEKMQANSKSGSQQCENPGQGNSGMNQLKQSSESLRQQLQKMIDQMKNGQDGQMSQQMGQSLMQHEMMQQMLREMMNNGSVGSETKNALQQIDDLLEQNRKELMNKSISAQTLARQHLISTRLLEAEKAELEREYEEKRESETAEDFYSNPVLFFEYKEKENFSIEYLNKNSHKLNNFYNSKYKEYLQNINNKK